jgi:hypothetical protein
MAERGRQLMKLVLIGGTGLILFAFALLILFSKLGDRQIDPEQELTKDAPKIEKVQVAENPDGSSVTIVRVPEDRVPDTFTERLSAAALTLLPSRAGYPEASGKTVAVPAPVQAQLTAATRAFLGAWEGYTLQTEAEGYVAKLRPLVAPGALGAISSRADSVDDTGVCIAQPSCTLGTEIYNGALPTANVIDYDGEHAYVTAYAPVRYLGKSSVDPRAGQVRQREYGLIFQRSGSTWLVQRAAAETLDAKTPTFEVSEGVESEASMGPGANR